MTATTGEWTVLASAVAGGAHLRHARPCQDAYRVERLADGTLVVAVADGAGSAVRGEEGARSAVDAAVTHLCHVFSAICVSIGWDALAARAFDVARDTVAALAAAEDQELRAFAATLTLVVAHPSLGFQVAQRGDGLVVARDGGNANWVAAQPQNGEYANQTFFLTDPDGGSPRYAQAFPPVDAFAVMTDGLLPLAVRLDTATPHDPFFAPLFAFAARAHDAVVAEQELAEFLLSDRVTGRTDDDRTLVIAVRPPGADDQRIPRIA